MLFFAKSFSFKVEGMYLQQNCLTEFSCETDFPKKTMIRDFSRFSEEDFNSEIAQVDWGSILPRTQGNNY